MTRPDDELHDMLPALRYAVPLSPAVWALVIGWWVW